MYSSALLVVLSIALSATAHAEPGAPIDYSKLAFYPEKWKAGGFAMELVPWQGDKIVFLTTTDKHDPATMTAFVGHLDAGWKLYADLTGGTPTHHRQVDGRKRGQPRSSRRSSTPCTSHLKRDPNPAN